MSAIPLVRVSAVLPFVKFLAQVGAPTEKLLNQARLSTTILDDPQALMPLYQSFAFGEKARHSEGIELLGALVSQRTEIVDLGVFGSLILQSLTLHDLLNTLASKLVLHNSGARVWVTEEEDRVWLHHQFINPAKIENQQAQYFVCLLILKAIQLVAGKQWHPDELHFQASELKGFRELNILFNTHVRFNQSDNAFCIPKSLLSLPLKRSGVDPSLQLQEIPSCTNLKNRASNCFDHSCKMATLL